MKLLSKAQPPSAHPYLPNKYTSWYYSIIESARTRQEWSSNEIWHRHHIIPECFFAASKRSKNPGHLEGDPNNVHNLVRLTVREHLLCHWLLTKMTTGNFWHKMEAALAMFFKYSKGRRRLITNTAQLARIIEAKTLAFKNLKQWKNTDGQVVFSTSAPGPQWINQGLTKGYREWTNGEIHTWSQQCPGEGWYQSGHNRGKTAWVKNNQMVYQKHCPGPDWIATNHLKNRKVWIKDGQQIFSQSCPGEGWIKGHLRKGQRQSKLSK